MLFRDRDETVNHIICEYSKLAQKEYKTKQDWVGKVIHKKLCKELKFDYTTKWYSHKLESVFENETNKRLWNLKIKMDPPIRAEGYT